MYDAIDKQIYTLRNDFIRKYNIIPDVAYLGHDQWYELKRVTLSMIFDDSILEYKIFGMKIKRVIDDSYIGVGIFTD